MNLIVELYPVELLADHHIQILEVEGEVPKARLEASSRP
jgi:hypothetical protein